MHFQLVIIVQLTCNTHNVQGGKLVGNDAGIVYSPLYDIWMICSCLVVLKDMCNITFVIRTQMMKEGLTFKP
jgi:hypothetical protein